MNRKMTAAELRAAIDLELDRCREKIHKLISEHVEEADWTPTPGSVFVPVPGSFTAYGELVPFAELCFCNPANGGGGVCCCTIGDRLVDPRAWANGSTTE